MQYFGKSLNEERHKKTFRNYIPKGIKMIFNSYNDKRSTSFPF